MSDTRRDHRVLFDGAPDGMAVVDPETGLHLDVNEQYCTLYGAERETLLETSLDSLTAPDWEAATTLHERLERAVTDGADRFEWRTVDTTGRPIPVEIAVSSVDWDGEEAAYLVRVAERTGREQRRAELKRKTRAMDEAPVGITISDPAQPDNPLVDVNAGFERQTATPPRRCSGGTAGSCRVRTPTPTRWRRYARPSLPSGRRRSTCATIGRTGRRSGTG